MSTPNPSKSIATAPPSRGESMAYPKQHSALSKLQWHLQQNSKAVLATLAFCVFVLVVTSDFIHDSDLGPQTLRGKITGASQGFVSNFAGALHSGYFSVEGSKVSDTVHRFAACTDLDQLSLVKDGPKAVYRSVVLPGTIARDPDTDLYTMTFDATRELRTGHNEAGRGAEFSELQIFNNRLLTFDDRTGDVFEILNKPDGQSSFVVPRFVLTEGEGDTDKGMKWEWATVKDGELYMGSMGKEFTKKDGSIQNTNNLWVSVLSRSGEIRRIDWNDQFNFVRNKLGARAPGYLIHEAVNWSPHMKKWIFAPRRISKEKYDDVLDEKRGSNKVVLVNEDFTQAEVVEVKMASKDGLHGFSSFAFIPGTNDKHVLALRSVEEDCAGDDLDVCKQRSYFVIFDVTTGDVLMDEKLIDEPLKYEGVEFVNMFTVPPN
jgi:soluble calcium-activated nucleotidase 1